MLGDIIFVSRNTWDIWFQEYRDSDNKYRHYGLDIGNDEIIHFVNYDDNGNLFSKVIISNKYEFMSKGTVNKCYRTSYKYSKYEIIKRALSYLNMSFNKYNPYENNCEHFVRWCVTGEKYYNDYDTYFRIKKDLNFKKNYL